MISRPILILIVLFLLASCVEKHRSNAEAVEVGSEKAVVVSEDATILPINLEKSSIHWKGTKMKGMGKHEGEIKLQEGQLLVKKGQLTGGYFVVDMQSITVTDIPEDDPIPRRNLTNHLKSEDFFAAKEYPTARFDITKVASLTKDSLQITGNLTIKDITKSIIFIVQQPDKSNLFITTFSFNRFNWKVAYEGNLLDRTLVDPNVELKIRLQTK